jgi:hypothetical protein
VRLTQEGATTTISFTEGTGRICGDCQLCCKLIPVEEIAKLAGQRCQHQRAHKGCTIYAKRPVSCRLWSCRWLIEPDAASLPRPDRAHYVIDMGEDAIRVRDDRTGEQRAVPVLQVWCDPAHPHAHRDPRLRAYLLRMAEQGVAAIIRYDSTRAFTLFAPPFFSDGQWHEVHSTVTSMAEHQAALAALGAAKP